MSARRFVLRAAVAALLLAEAAAARADFDQAMAYFRAGKFLEAAAQFQGMVDAAPTYDYGHYMLGHCLERMGRPEEAERSFRTAIELRNDKAEYRHGLALALKDQRRYGPALGVLSEGAGLVRNRQSAFAFLSLRGYLLAAMRRWPEAIADLERAVAIKRDPTLLDLLGRANFALGRYDRAASAFAAAIQGAPLDPRQGRLLAEALLQLAASVPDPSRRKLYYTQAMASAERLRKLQPDDLEATALLGRASLGAGRYAAAESAFRAVLAAHPGSCSAFINLSRSLVAQDRVAEAEAALTNAARCAPTMPEVHEDLGRVYLRQERFALALDAFRRANEIQPSPNARAAIEALRVKLGGGGD